MIGLLPWISLLVPVVFLLFLGVRDYVDANGWTESVTMAYYALFLLPFALIVSRKGLRWTLVFLILITLMLSSKRGGFIAFVFAVAVYFLIEWRLAGKSSSKRFLLVVGAIVFAIAFYSFLVAFSEANNLAILNRIANLGADEGSGRPDVWACVWQMICSSDPLSIIFGHGFNTVIWDSPMGLSAHNDFLEVVYDYGVVGFVLYLRLYMHLYQMFLRVKADLPKLAPAFAASLILMVFMSFVAHLIIYPTHFLFLCLFWGVVAGRLNAEGSVSPRGYF